METVNIDYVEYSQAECDQIRSEYFTTKEKHDSDLSQLQETAEKIDKLMDDQSLLLRKSRWAHPIHDDFSHFRVKIFDVDDKSCDFSHNIALAKFNIWNKNIKISEETLYSNLSKHATNILKEELKAINSLQKEADFLLLRVTHIDSWNLTAV